MTTMEALESLCKNDETSNDTSECIERTTYNFSDIIKNAVSSGKSLGLRSQWDENIFNFYYGKMFTLRDAFQLGINYSESFNLTLQEKKAYYIWIHDPNYFLSTTNPDVVPHVLVSNVHAQIVWIFLRPVYHHKISRLDARCEDSADYSFTKCVRTSIGQKIGCRMAWDSWSSRYEG